MMDMVLRGMFGVKIGRGGERHKRGWGEWKDGKMEGWKDGKSQRGKKSKGQ
jgi:hypothetical protein